MKRFWRRKMKNNQHQMNHEIEESKERLKETQDRWPEVRRAQQNLDQLIERALRGGA